ncbi:MAG: HEAT repeat domain-containing protein [Planctomycetota bacterium]|nr:HEAT repeat domain-containing protein [Planctomycetota bacterium]
MRNRLSTVCTALALLLSVGASDSVAAEELWGRKAKEWVSVIKRAAKADENKRFDNDAEYRVALHAAARLAKKDKGARRALLAFLGERALGTPKLPAEDAYLETGSQMRDEVIPLVAGIGAEIVPDLLKILGGKNRLAREAAIEVLGQMKQPGDEALAALSSIAATDGDEPMIALYARRALILQKHDVRAHLARIQTELEGGSILTWTASDVAALGAHARPLLPALEALVAKQGDDDGIWLTYGLIAALAKDPRPALAKLVARATVPANVEKDPEEARLAWDGLRLAGPASIDVLTKLAKSHQDKDVRLEAARALHAHGRAAIPALIEVLGSRHDNTVRWVVLYVSSFGPAAESAASELRRYFPNKARHVDVLEVLAAIGPAAIRTAMDILKQDDLAMGTCLGDAFAMWGEQLIPELKARLDDGNETVRANAAEQLGATDLVERHKRRLKPLLNKLQRLYKKDKSQRVRMSAYGAILRIKG